MEYSDNIEIGTIVKSLWNDELGEVKYNTALRKSAGEVTILWFNGITTREVWKCDIVPV